MIHHGLPKPAIIQQNTKKNKTNLVQFGHDNVLGLVRRCLSREVNNNRLVNVLIGFVKQILSNICRLAGTSVANNEQKLLVRDKQVHDVRVADSINSWYDDFTE